MILDFSILSTNQGRLNFAASIYERMLADGVAPSIQTFNTMITVHGRSRDLDKAIEMFNTARTKGVTLDEKAYTNLICYYGKAGRSGEASILFKQMQEEGIKPGQVSYNIMMNVYASGGLYKEAGQVFSAMQRDGYSPDSFTYLALVRARVAAHKYMEAEEAISLMENPSCAHYNLLLSAYAKAGSVGEVERVIYELLITTAGLTPDVACYAAMLRVYLDYGYVEKGISLFEQEQIFEAGHQQQVFMTYREARAACLETSLKKLGIEKLHKDDVQKMQWEVLEAKIGNWIHFVRIAVKLLFAAERKVSDEVFEGMSSFMDQCFAEAAASSVSLLLSFGEAIAKSKRSPNHIWIA